jgi:hypothetical protein
MFTQAAIMHHASRPVIGLLGVCAFNALPSCPWSDSRYLNTTLGQEKEGVPGG